MSNNESLKSNIKCNIFGRYDEFYEIWNLLDILDVNQTTKQISSPFMLIYGARKSGKKLVLNRILKMKNINYIYMDCSIITTVKQFFDKLLNSIHTRFGKYSKNTYAGWRCKSIYKDCLSVNTFYHILMNENISNYNSFYVVLNNFQTIYNMDTKLLLCMICVYVNI